MIRPNGIYRYADTFAPQAGCFHYCRFFAMLYFRYMLRVYAMRLRAFAATPRHAALRCFSLYAIYALIIAYARY